jgi:ABC-type branched-subunit amino acid transport system ATPase component
MSNRLASHFGLRDPRLQSLAFPLITVATKTTAAAVTFSTTEVLGGIILRDPNGAGRADLLPTAANLADAVQGAMIGTGFEFTIRNTADAAETITVTTNTGLTLSGTMTIAQNNSKRFLAVFTNVTPGSEAVTVYSLGTVVH